MPISLMQAFRASNLPTFAFTGAGGKTTAWFHLARELKNFSPVIVSASSHLGSWQISLSDQHIIITSPEAVDELEQQLQAVTLVTGALEGDRTKPLDMNILDRLNGFCKR